MVRYPAYPGYCQIGHVMGIGAGVTGFNEGDRVASVASHRQFAVVPAATVYPVPGALADEEAVWATLSHIVQHGVRKANIAMGEVVVVIGLGLLGQLAVQYARLSGAAQVIAIDAVPLRLEMAARHGASHTLAVGAQDALAAVSDITGNAQVFAAALGLLRRFGKLVLIGDTGTPAEQHLTGDVIKRDLQILGAHAINPPPHASDYARWSRAAMVQLFFGYLEREQMKVADLITHRFPVEQAPAAYELLRQDRAAAMGVLFNFENRQSNGKDTPNETQQ